MTSEEQQRRRGQLYGLLGELPPRGQAIPAETISIEDRGTFTLERLVLGLNGVERVPAYFIKPAGLRGPAPAILYNHYHGGKYKLGKDELLLAKPAMRMPSYAEALTRLGCCALCIDTWAFGERSARTELDIFKDMLWQGRVMWGMMVFDSLRAFDYLRTRSEVDPSRIGTLGMSMGSTMAWWVAALEPRIKVCVDICCLTDYQAIRDAGLLAGHGVYYFVPSLVKHFTTAQINALIAPRPHLGLAGNRDKLTPPAGLDRIDAELKQVYAVMGHSENWKLVRYDVGHIETPAMRREVLAFLQARL
jgi:dienelactone hydrolase